MSEPVKRARDIEEFSNRIFIHPVSAALVPVFAALKFTPNLVSILGMVSGASASYFYFHYAQGWTMAVVGFALMLIWHVFDGADGQLARLTNSQSEFGKVIDGICDYVVFISVYVALGIILQAQYGAIIWLAVVGAGIAHAVQAGAYETQRQMFDFWALGKKSAEVPSPDAQAAPGLFSALAHGYGRMQFRFSGLTPTYFKALYNSAAQSPDALARVRGAYRAQFAHTVHRWSIMCANYRTFAIFIACVLGQPLWYFLWELLILGPLHLLLALQQRRWNQSFQQHHLQ